ALYSVSVISSLLFYLRLPAPPSSSLFPYTTLFRSGLFGEAGSLLSELKKKQRDRDSYVGYSSSVVEEFGDTLWYFSNIASRAGRSEEHTSELQSRFDLVCRLLLEKKKLKKDRHWRD